MKFRRRRIIISFIYAIRGIHQAVKYEANMRIHLLAAVLAVLFGTLLHILPYEWLMLLMTITLVIFAELMNTALEANVDLVTKQRRPEARIAKDVAAGAVLVTSINALIIGIIIFGPRFWGYFFG